MATAAVTDLMTKDDGITRMTILAQKVAEKTTTIMYPIVRAAAWYFSSKRWRDAASRGALKPQRRHGYVDDALNSGAPQHAGVDHALAGIEADRIRQVRRTRDAPQREVGALAHFQAADVALAAERARGVEGAAGQRLARRQAPQGADHVHRQQQGRHRRRAGIAVGGDGHRH